MSMSDPIADLLCRIRNANLAGLEKVDAPNAKLKVALCQILKDQGYLKNFKVITNDKQGTLRIFLRYGPNREKIITQLERVSRPGRRCYAKWSEITPVLNGRGTAVVSTSRGLQTDVDCRKNQVGGEIICRIW